MKYNQLLFMAVFCLGLSSQSIADIETGLVAYYPFNGNANDLSVNGNDGTVNGATLTTDRFAQADSAYFFNGIDNFISAPVDINPDAVPIITMTAWVVADDFDRQDARAPLRQIVSHDNGGFDRSFGIDSRAVNGVGWSMLAGSSSVLGGIPVVKDVWTFLAASYNEVTGTARFYVNGMQVLEVNASTSSGEEFIRIGSNPLFGEFFFGKIDDVRIYNRELSLSEIQILYQGESVIADSIEEFSGTQGQDNWFYGYYVSPFQSSSFNLMTEFTEFNSVWKVQTGTYWTALYDTGGHPNGLNTGGIEHWAVRRYTSEVSGNVKITGMFKKINVGGGDGTTGLIIVDGVTVFSHDVEGTDGIGINYEIETEVNEGSTVDFVITPGEDSIDGADDTFFSALITLVDDSGVDEVSCTDPGTVSLGLDILIPSLDYQSLLGIQNIWAELKYTGLNAEGKNSWELKDFGVNPQ